MIETSKLWRPTGQAERDLVAAAHWRAWPPRLPDQPIFYPVLNRWYATRIAREWNVPAGGVGYVTSFEVRRDYLDRFPVQQAGGRDVLEYWIPAEELEEFNANIVGEIIEEADYRAPLPDTAFTSPVPAAWRTYLQGPSWLRRGRLDSGAVVELFTPAESAERLDEETRERHPGILVIGNDGGRGQFAVDLRQDAPQVVLVEHNGKGWDTALHHADTITDFVERLDAVVLGYAP